MLRDAAAVGLLIIVIYIFLLLELFPLFLTGPPVLSRAGRVCFTALASCSHSAAAASGAIGWARRLVVGVTGESRSFARSAEGLAGSVRETSKIRLVDVSFACRSDLEFSGFVRVRFMCESLVAGS